MDASPRPGCTYAFGSFRLNPQRRTVLHNGKLVPLTSRLFDALLCLVQNHDRLVERGELEQAIWPGRSVEDGNLQKAVAAVRKALEAEEPRETLIVTVAGRGFRFTMPVVLEPNDSEPAGIIAREPSSPDTPPSRSPWWQSRGILAACVAIAVLVVATGTLSRYWLPGGNHQPSPPLATEAPFAPPPHSVAVLAFSNLSGDPGQDYFSDGLSEEVIDSLGRVGGIRVVARQSAFSFKGKPATIVDIARLLNVGTVLEGSVRREGPRLRITAQLIDAATGYQLWSNHYDRDDGDILRVQGGIAEAGTASLQVKLLDADVARLTIGGTANPKALDAYLHAITIRRANQAGANQHAKAAFDEALALDPNFALAHARLADLLTDIAYGSSQDTADLAYMRKVAADGVAEGELAVSLAPKLGVAHEALGNSALALWQFTRADNEFSLAKDLAPEDAQISRRYAMFQLDLGHVTAAVAAAKFAVELNPLSAESYSILALILAEAGRADDAAASLSHAEQLGLNSHMAASQRALLEMARGDMAAASHTCSPQQGWLENVCLAIAYHALGKQNDAEAQLAKLRVMEGDVGAYNYAYIYAQWGRIDEALQWLETAYRLHDVSLAELNAVHWPDAIRNTPRFKEIERQMNFPP